MQTLQEVQAKEIEALQARREVYVEASALIKQDPYRQVQGPAINVCVSHIATDYIDALVRQLDRKIAELQQG